MQEQKIESVKELKRENVSITDRQVYNLTKALVLSAPRIYRGGTQKIKKSLLNLLIPNNRGGEDECIAYLAITIDNPREAERRKTDKVLTEQAVDSVFLSDDEKTAKK